MKLRCPFMLEEKTGGLTLMAANLSLQLLKQAFQWI